MINRLNVQGLLELQDRLGTPSVILDQILHTYHPFMQMMWLSYLVTNITQKKMGVRKE